MAFVKLDTGILRSTLWIDREAREVFITALLMAEPREFRENVDQIAVDEIKLTGFSAPPGWYGFIEAAGVGIVRYALVDPVLGMEALRRLGNPDPESRSKNHGGRRLIRVDGGYLVLNFIEYREKDHTSSERSRRWRERQRAKSTRKDTNDTRVGDSATHSQRENVISERRGTQAEAEAEAEGRKHKSVCANPREVFESIKAAYPRGLHRGDQWRNAERQVYQLIEAGETPESLVSAAGSYAAQQTAMFTLGTGKVMRPHNFFASDVWRGPFPMPESNGKTPLSIVATSAWERLLASDGAERPPEVDRALQAIGGWQRVRMRTDFDAGRLKSEFCHAFDGGSHA